MSNTITKAKQELDFYFSAFLNAKKAPYSPTWLDELYKAEAAFFTAKANYNDLAN